jgi:hypothetical protein
MLETLNRNPGSKFHLTDSQCEKIVIYTRFSREFIQKKFDSERLTVRRLMLPRSEEILLAAIHQPSKLYWSDQSQSFECVELASTIRGIEKDVGHQRTVLVGDFNMDPFEAGIVAANGLNAVMSRNVAARQFPNRTRKGLPLLLQSNVGTFRRCRCWAGRYYLLWRFGARRILLAYIRSGIDSTRTA